MAPTVLKRFTDFDVTKMPFMTGNDIKVGDIIESYEEIEVKQTL